MKNDYTGVFILFSLTLSGATRAMLSKSLNDWINKVLKTIKDVFAVILIFLLLVFVLGELWAMTFIKSNNQVMLWLPVGLLLLILFIKAID